MMMTLGGEAAWAPTKLIVTEQANTAKKNRFIFKIVLEVSERLGEQV
jgi:hypothetical protein